MASITVANLVEVTFRLWPCCLSKVEFGEFFLQQKFLQAGCLSCHPIRSIRGLKQHSCIVFAAELIK